MKVDALNWNKIGNIPNPMNSRSFGIFTITGCVVPS